MDNHVCHELADDELCIERHDSRRPARRASRQRTGAPRGERRERSRRLASTVASGRLRPRPYASSRPDSGTRPDPRPSSRRTDRSRGARRNPRRQVVPQRFEFDRRDHAALIPEQSDHLAVGADLPSGRGCGSHHVSDNSIEGSSVRLAVDQEPLQRRSRVSATYLLSATAAARSTPAAVIQAAKRARVLWKQSRSLRLQNEPRARGGRRSARSARHPTDRTGRRDLPWRQAWRDRKPRGLSFAWLRLLACAGVGKRNLGKSDNRRPGSPSRAQGLPEGEGSTRSALTLFVTSPYRRAELLALRSYEDHRTLGPAGSFRAMACACSSAVARRSSACCEALSLTALAAVSATSLATCLPCSSASWPTSAACSLTSSAIGADALVLDARGRATPCRPGTPPRPRRSRAREGSSAQRRRPDAPGPRPPGGRALPP